LRDAALQHVIEHGGHFLIELPGTTGYHFITRGITHARVPGVNAAAV
jgi:hypothetical protein